DLGTTPLPANRCRARRPVIITHCRVTAALRPRLSAAANAVFEAGQLFDPDRSTGVEPSGSNANLRAKTELAAIGELRRGIMQDDGRVDLAQEFFGRFAVFGHDRISVMRA